MEKQGAWRVFDGEVLDRPSCLVRDHAELRLHIVYLVGGPNVELFNSLPHPSSSGGGFSYSNVFDTWNGTNEYSPFWSSNATMDPAMQERLDQGFFNTI
eukprot:scaffold12163_cov176-Amphora_coffeaeformis.AAC.8